MTGATDDRLVSMKDIADVSGKSLPALSNARRREPQFPVPVAQGDRGDLYRYGDVLAWLAATNRPLVREVTAATLAWNAAAGLRSQLSPEEVSRLLLEAAALTGLDPDPSQGGDCATRVTRAAIAHPEVAGCFRILGQSYPLRHEATVAAVLDILSGLDQEAATTAFTEIANRSADRAGVGIGDFVTSNLLAELMVGLLPGTPTSIYDPAAGMGGLLEAAHRAHPERLHLYGQELNPAAAELARLRFALAGVSATITVGDTLAKDLFEGLTSDAVLCETPIGVRLPESFRELDPRWEYGIPARGAADLAWVQHAVAHLSPGNPDARAVVATPLTALTRGGRDRAIREELVRRLTVEAVITLPPGFLAASNQPAALWLLRPPDQEGPEQVLFINVSQPHQDLQSILQQWRDESPLSNRDAAVTVAVRELLSPQASLLPERWLTSPDPAPASRQDDFRDALQAAQRAAAKLAALPPLPTVALSGNRTPQFDCLAVLADAGQLELLRSPISIPITETLAHDIPVLTPDNLNTPDRAAQYVRADTSWPTTQPGDVLITRAGPAGIRTAVETRTRVPVRSVIVARIAGDWITPQTLAALLVATEPLTLSTSPRLHPKAVALPRLAPNQYRELDQLLSTAQIHSHSIRDYLDDLAELTRTLRAAVPATRDITQAEDRRL